MNKYIIFATFIASFVVIGVVRRTSRTRKGNVAAQLLGGLNVFAAALLAWMTLVTLFMALNNNLGLPDAFLNWSSVTFVIVIAVLWISRGLVPQSIIVEKRKQMWFGHCCVLVGTAIHGSVTFYVPILVWLGLLTQEDAAVLPWFAILTLPIACILWGIGLILIFKSGSKGHLFGDA